MYSLIWTDFFVKKSKKFFKKHPDLIDDFKEVVKKLSEDPFNNSLKTHILHGNLKGKYGISITFSYRLVIDIKVKKNEILLLNIGTHNEVY